MKSNTDETITETNTVPLGLGEITPKEAIDHINEHLDSGEQHDAEVRNIFPIDCFPVPVQEIANHTKARLSFLPDYLGPAILAATSMAIGNTYRIEIKEGFQQPAILFIALVGPPGSNKSEPLAWVMDPIAKHDANSYTVYMEQVEKYIQLENLSKKERKQLSAKELKKPVWVKMLVTDFTVEALWEVHIHNTKGIGICADELLGLHKRAGRYSGSGMIETFLTSWAGKAIIIDRKSEASTLISMPCMTIIGTIQNGVLHEFAKAGRMNGYLDRYLFTDSDNVKKEPWTKKGIDPEICKSWQQKITKLLSLTCKYDLNGNPIPKVIRFSSVAQELLFDWQSNNTKMCIYESEAIAGIYAKLDLYVPRLALILHLLYWACADEEFSPMEEVSVGAVEGAIKLAEYFRVGAVKANKIISSYNPLDKLPTDKRDLYEALPQRFSKAEGLSIAVLRGIPPDTFNKWLAREVTNLFKLLKKGEYEKLV